MNSYAAREVVGQAQTSFFDEIDQYYTHIEHSMQSNREMIPVVVNEWKGMLVTFSILEIQGWFI